MATQFSTEQALINGPQYGLPPATRVKVNKQHGRVRMLEATVTVPVGGYAIGDKIVFGKLPQRSRVIGHLSSMSFSAGTAGATLALGDNVVAARHLAATSIAAAGTAVPNAQSAAGASFETSDDSNSVANSFASTTDDCTVVGTLAGAGMPAGQVVTLRLAYTHD